MGAVTFSLDHRLVDALRSVLSITALVETGTFKGDTVANLEPYFDKVVSIELSETLWADAAKRFQKSHKVQILHGSSQDKLRELRSELENIGALYWLDAHWCVSTDTAGELSQCPLIEEIQAIEKLNSNSVVLIDDARLFLAPPLAPHEISQWPCLHQIIANLFLLSSEHQLMVVNDVIAFYPLSAKSALETYAQNYGIDWLIATSYLRESGCLMRQLEAKESVIQQKELAIKQITCDIQHKEFVIHQKELAIQQITHDVQPKELVIQQMGNAIQQMGNAVQQITSDIQRKELVIQQMGNAIQQNELAFQEITRALQQKELAIQAIEIALRDKERVINAQIVAIKSYRLAFWPLRPILPSLRVFAMAARRFVEITRPRLGNLNQYSPRPLSKSLTHFNVHQLTTTPKLSIVTPSFQQGGYIERTIESVLSQGYPNLEYFIQDGGSTDDTIDVLKRYQEQLSGWVSEKDNGQSQAINLGFAKTRGEIMGWLNSDDLLLPGALTRIIDYFNRHPEVDVVYGNRLLIDTSDMEIGRWVLPGHNSKVLSWVDYVPQETMFWRRRIWNKVGGQIDESFRFAMDWDLLVRFRDVGAKFAHIPQFMGAFRIHELQKTSAAINDIGHQEMNRIRTRVLGRLPTNSELRRAVSLFMLKHVLVDLGYRIRIRMKGK